MNHSATGNSVQFVDQDVTTSTGASLICTTDSSPTPGREVTHTADQTLTGLQINRPDITYVEHVDDSVFGNRTLVPGSMERRSFGGIPGRLGIVGDRCVQLSIRHTFYQTLVRAGAPLGVLGPTARTLRSANGTKIGVSGCSLCVVSFMGL